MVFILFSWFYGTFLNRVFIAMLDYLRVVEATEPAAPHVPGYQRRGAPGGPWGSQHDFIYVYVCSYIDIYIMGWFSSMFLRIGWFSICSTVLYEEFRAPARCSKGSFLARQLVPGNPWISIFSSGGIWRFWRLLAHPSVGTSDGCRAWLDMALQRGE